MCTTLRARCLTRSFRTSRIDLLEAEMRMSEGGLDDVCRRGAPGSTVTTTPRPATRPTCVVVVPEVLEDG